MRTKPDGQANPSERDHPREAQAEEAREKFLCAIGHRPTDHRRDADPTDLREPRANCSWWWCLNPLDVRGEREWCDLLAAFEELKTIGRAFEGPEAASIAMAYNGSQLWREQVDDTERLAETIESFAAPEGTDAAFLRAEFLERLRPLRALGMHAQGRTENRGPRIDRAVEQALEVGERHGWQPREVAAMLLIVGVDRSRWDALRDRIAKAENRRKSRKLQPP
jgi:hypothetical protein